jgi:hypothetical protein
MVRHFYGQTTWPSLKEADQEIIDLVNWAAGNLGHEKSITLRQLADLAKAYYASPQSLAAQPALSRMGRGEVKPVRSVDDIKYELAAGRPVIVGAAGKLLPNPHFSNGGPVYHMLVITGYDEAGFITNDPGIRQGENFRYTFDALYAAIHDWNPQNIRDGAKNMLVFP